MQLNITFYLKTNIVTGKLKIITILKNLSLARHCDPSYSRGRERIEIQSQPPISTNKPGIVVIPIIPSMWEV
jgi:hypothetical protein